MTDRCPHCHHVLTPKPIRNCFDCGVNIGRHHKWTLELRNGVPTPVHRSCEHPQSYYSLAEAKERKLPPYNGVGSVKEDEEYARLHHERMAGLPPEPSAATVEPC